MRVCGTAWPRAWPLLTSGDSSCCARHLPWGQRHSHRRRRVPPPTLRHPRKQPQVDCARRRRSLQRAPLWHPLAAWWMCGGGSTGGTWQASTTRRGPRRECWVLGKRGATQQRQLWWRASSQDPPPPPHFRGTLPTRGAVEAPGTLAHSPHATPPSPSLAQGHPRRWRGARRPARHRRAASHHLHNYPVQPAAGPAEGEGVWGTLQSSPARSRAAG